MQSASAERILKFLGPFPMNGDVSVIDHFPDSPGVYLWCVNCLDGATRVHYVGEAASIRARIYQHRREQERGNYHAFSPDFLRRNLKVITHRAGVGVVPRFAGQIDADQANNDYSKCISIFYAVLPDDTDKRQRCQFETAIGYAIEDWGPNILAVGRMNRRIGKLRPYGIDTGDVNIEGLTGEEIEVGIIDAA